MQFLIQKVLISKLAECTVRLMRIQQDENAMFELASNEAENIVEAINKQNDGTFLLLKSLASQKPIIKLLKLPAETNIDEDEEDF